MMNVLKGFNLDCQNSVLCTIWTWLVST